MRSFDFLRPSLLARAKKAILAGNIDLLRRALDAGLSPNHVVLERKRAFAPKDETTLLALAIRANEEEMVEMLLARGAKPGSEETHEAYSLFGAWTSKAQAASARRILVALASVEGFSFSMGEVLTLDSSVAMTQSWRALLDTALRCADPTWSLQQVEAEGRARGEAVRLAKSTPSIAETSTPRRRL